MGDNRGGEGWSAWGAGLLSRLSHAQMFGAAEWERRGANRGAEKVRDIASSEERGMREEGEGGGVGGGCRLLGEKDRRKKPGTKSKRSATQKGKTEGTKAAPPR